MVGGRSSEGVSQTLIHHGMSWGQDPPVKMEGASTISSADLKRILKVCKVESKSQLLT